MDHIAHQDGLDGRAFHLTDPNPKSAGQVINTFARAAHAPEFAMRIDRQMHRTSCRSRRGEMIAQLPPVRRITDQVLGDFGIPREALSYIDYPSDYDSRDAQAALEGSGITVPALEGTRTSSGTTGSATSTRTCSRTAACAARSRARWS